MKAFPHAATTWVVAHGLHPIFFLLHGIALSGGKLNLGDGFFFFFYLLMALLFSLPALLLSALLLAWLWRLKEKLNRKYVAWIVLCQVLLFVNIQAVVFFFGGGLFLEAAQFGIPAHFATLVAILIRRRQFVGGVISAMKKSELSLDDIRQA